MPFTFNFGGFNPGDFGQGGASALSGSVSPGSPSVLL